MESESIILSKHKQSSIVLSLDECKELLTKDGVFFHLFRYKQAKLYVYDLDIVFKPMIKILLLRYFSISNNIIIDSFGREINLSLKLQIASIFKFATVFLLKAKAIKVANEYLQLIEKNGDSEKYFNINNRSIYLRTDMAFGLKAGGSVGHIAGVINNLHAHTDTPLFFSTDSIPTVDERIHTYIIKPNSKYFDFPELVSLDYNNKLIFEIQQRLFDKSIAFIYQRYSMNNYSGLYLSVHYNVPYVCEYNGSEIWMSKNWGNNPLKYEAIAERIEMLNLRFASLIVVVSDVMRHELEQRGIPADKILVNPNGVDPERYHPNIFSEAILKKYHINGKVVIGFIGTFGLWHGADILAKAYCKLLDKDKQYRDKTVLFLIGSGKTLNDVKRIVNASEYKSNCIFTHSIPQEQGPNHLSICDILVAPHVPNPDGTAFFGSPTKLFEYMSMGKGIVASDLYQIGQIIEHNRTGLLVTPGNVESLMLGIKELVDNSQKRSSLGMNARDEVLNKYTWKIHTEKIVDRLKKLYC